MISFKYGVILGAILFICIYLAYKGTTIKEGIDGMPTNAALKELYLDNCVQKLYTSDPTTTDLPEPWLSNRGAAGKYLAGPGTRGVWCNTQLFDGTMGKDMTECGFPNMDGRVKSWSEMSSGGEDEYRWNIIPSPPSQNSHGDSRGYPALGYTTCVTGGTTGMDNAVSPSSSMCAFMTNSGFADDWHSSSTSADKEALCFSKVPIGGDGYMLKGAGYCPGGTPEALASFKACRDSCSGTCAGFAYRLTSLDGSTPNCRTWTHDCATTTKEFGTSAASVWAAYTTDPIIPDTTCVTYKKCKQLGYELDPTKTTTPCNNHICDDAQCCSKDTCASAGTFKCVQQHHLDPAKQDYVCGNDCNSDTCCKLNNTCGVDPPTCPSNQYYSAENSAIVCANAECLPSDCCVGNPTCNSYMDCNTAKQHVGNPSQPCVGGTCNKSCCVDNKKCSNFKKCNPKRHVDPNKRDTACNNNVCTDKQCCADNPKCSDETDYSCPSSQYVSLAKKAQTCIGEKCTGGECCIPEPTCSTYQCSHPDTEHMPDNTIPCPNGICDDKTCCIPNIKCSTFKNCNPGRHIKEEDISCSNNVCSDEQCCITNAKCGQFDESGFTCEDNEYIKLPNHTCKEAKCTPQECCVTDPTCGSYTCSVGHLQHIKDPSILCPDGNCTDELCCVDNDKCNSFTCPVGKHGIAEDERCTDNICTKDQCCVNNQRCSTFWCDENYTLTNMSSICKNKECTAKECCEPNQTCSSFSCEAGYTMRSSPADRICEHLLCTGGDCCLENQKCSTYNCRAGQTKKENNEVCKDIKCTNEECCLNNPTCSTYNCESSYYTTRTLVPHAEGIICGELKCKESECCDIKSTNKLPKINVWPLYDNS